MLGPRMHLTLSRTVKAVRDREECGIHLLWDPTSCSAHSLHSPLTFRPLDPRMQLLREKCFRSPLPPPPLTNWSHRLVKPQLNPGQTQLHAGVLGGCPALFHGERCLWQSGALSLFQRCCLSSPSFSKPLLTPAAVQTAISPAIPVFYLCSVGTQVPFHSIQ